MSNIRDEKQSHKAKKVVERMAKKLNRQMVGSMAACVHCGMCTEAAIDPTI